MRLQADFPGAGGEVGHLAFGGGLAGDVAADGRADAVDELSELGEAGVSLKEGEIGFARPLAFAAEEHDEFTLPAELAPQAFDLRVFEALHITGRILGVIAMLAKNRQNRSGEITAFFAMPGRGLQLGVDADGASGGAVQSLDELDLFLERDDLERTDADREAAREDRLTGLRIKTFARVELL